MKSNKEKEEIKEKFIQSLSENSTMSDSLSF